MIVPPQRIIVAGYALTVIGLAANLHGYYPYYLAYYSPLFGGGPAAEQILPVGWGEGLELQAAFIAAQPDGRDRPITVFYQPVLRRLPTAGVAPLQAIRNPRRVDYAVSISSNCSDTTRT
ncbi:MAG: hypothetical protein RMJ55_05320 [Roseiflexaceae bacterium]|nr:hypothetical protein [Roseiflexaceae bacterium]